MSIREKMQIIDEFLSEPERVAPLPDPHQSAAEVFLGTLYEKRRTVRHLLIELRKTPPSILSIRHPNAKDTPSVQNPA